MRTLAKLSVLSVAVLGTSVAMAADGVVRNTTNAVVGGGKTIFQTVTHPAAVSAEIGTLGYGANVAWGVNETTELQAGWSGISDSNSDSITDKTLDIDIDDVKGEVNFTKAKLNNPYIGVQMRPAANWFTVGAGVIVPTNELAMTLEPTDGKFTIDGNEYLAKDVGVLSADIEHKNKLAPYATIGFRPNINNKWGVYGELGAAYMGGVAANVTAKGGSNLPQVQAETKKAADDLENKIESTDALDWWPIAKLGVTYRF